MASTTTNLGLTKPAYSDDADISDINGNMDLIDAEAGKVRANVAANYDSSETYAVGDYCLHDGSLYKCTTAISSPESWTAGHWTQIKIAGELSSLTDQIENIISFENFPVTADQYGMASIGLTTNRSNKVISAMSVTDWQGVTLIVPASNNNYVNVLIWDRITGKPVSSGTSATIRLSIFAG